VTTDDGFDGSASSDGTIDNETSGQYGSEGRNSFADSTPLLRR